MLAMLTVCTAADDALTANAAQLRHGEEERRELELALTASASRVAALEARARSSANAMVALKEEKRLAEARCAEAESAVAELETALASAQAAASRSREEASLASAALAQAQSLRAQLQQPTLAAPPRKLAHVLAAACIPPVMLALLMLSSHQPSQCVAALLCSLGLVCIPRAPSATRLAWLEARIAELETLLAASERAAQLQLAASALASQDAEAELRALHAAAREALADAEARVHAAQRSATPEAKVAAVARLAAILTRESGSPPPAIRVEAPAARKPASPARLTREEAAMLASLLAARSPTRGAGAAQRRPMTALDGQSPRGASLSD